MSLDIILPNASAQPYRVPATRFGYILQVTKERYKDTSLDLGSAGEKVKALINEHLISLGINPRCRRSNCWRKIFSTNWLPMRAEQ